MSLTDDLLAANEAYRAGFDAADLQLRPIKKLAILTCMDSRYTAQGVLGLSLGDAHVIRNAGGRVTEDAVRSLSLSAALLGTRACVIIHHSDCGLFGRSDEELRQRVAEVAGTRATFGFLPFEDLEQSVRDDVAALRASPYFPPEYEVLGFTYDVRTGRLAVVEG
ncbi:MAG: beta-class carbonic anhydrase [Dehalococcoidia bacterium]